MTAYKKYAESLRQNLQNAPINKASFERPLSRCDSCHGYCCYDSVELEADESDIIGQLVKDERAFFTSVGIDLPDEVIVAIDPDDASAGVGITTKERNFSEEVAGYPKHFENTSCVFLTDAGWCSLQMLSVARGFHKWHYKPLVCWMFPLSPYDHGDKFEIHIKNGDSETKYPDYAGFVAYTGCGKTCPDGQPARIVLAEEIEYLGKIIGRDIAAELDQENSV